MSVSNTTVKQLYAANGILTTFAIPFAYIEGNGVGQGGDAIRVTSIDTVTGLPTLQTLGVDYNLTPDEETPTNVVFVVAPASTVKILVERRMDIRQVINLLNSSDFLLETVMEGLDRLALLIQQVNDTANRAAIVHHLNEGVFDPELPLIVTAGAADGGKSIILNPTATGFALGATSADIQAANQAALDAAASAAAALASETAAAQSASDAAQSLTDVQAAEATAIADIQAEGATQIGLVQAEGATQIGLVQDEGTTQQALLAADVQAAEDAATAAEAAQAAAEAAAASIIPLPGGGTAGQLLTKQSGTDGDADWEDPAPALPVGGTAGQVLVKQGPTDGDADWEDPAVALPLGGSAGQYLRKTSGTDGDAAWAGILGSEVANTPAGSIAATTVQGALNELDGDLTTVAGGLAAHLADTVDAHMASAIGNTPSGNLAATTVQGALNELQTDIDTRATTTTVTGLRTSSTFSGTTITPTAGSLLQTWLYNGGSAQAMNAAPVGTISGLTNGTVFRIMGSDDTNTISLAHSDTTNGMLLNGAAVLGKGQSIDLEYNSTLARLVEISRNF